MSGNGYEQTFSRVAECVRFTPESRRGSGRARESVVDPKATFLGSKIKAVYRPSRVIDCLVMVLARLASDAVLDVAYGWLCHRRRDYL